MIAVQLVLISGLLLYIVPGRYRLYDIVLYDASENVPENPLIGYAPRAELEEDCENTNLVFIQLPFSELEPEEGTFAFDRIEDKYHLEKYRRAGKHGVLRLVCDSPGSQAHRDIPEWLYAATGTGKPYADASGKGYAPDYADETFLAAHEEALLRLADWCRKDSFISYVEMGSVGQNGDWDSTAPSAEGLAPSEETLARYAAQYEQAFPADSGIRLMNSSVSGQTAGAGEWKDALGDTKTVPGWIAARIDVPAVRSQETAAGAAAEGIAETGGEEELSAWMKGPVGGGLTEKVPMDDLLMDSLSDTLGQLRSAHVSFIGPVCPDASRQGTNGSGMILRDVGYCIYLSRLQTTVDFIRDDLLLHFTFSNIGHAPLYWDWPVTMYIYDREGQCVREEVLDLAVSGLMPGESTTVTGSVKYSRKLLKGYTAAISIKSPDGKDHVTLAQKGVQPDEQGIHRVYRYRGRRKK